MIPKKIHYCWLSGAPLPRAALRCIDTWKRVMPDYELTLWDKNRFDVDSVAFTREACSVKKWAFAADYIRMHAIFTEGGVYMDTDVYALKRFDEFLDNGFFTAIEYHKEEAIKSGAAELLNEDGTLKDQKYRIFTRSIGLQAALLGGVVGHPFAKSCIDRYANQHFILPDGSYYDKIISPALFADAALAFGLRYKDELQKLNDGLTVYPSRAFAGSVAEAEEGAYAVHCCRGGWRDKPPQGLWQKIRGKLSENTLLRKILGKKTL